MEKKTNEPPVENDKQKKKRKQTCILCGPTDAMICRIPRCERIRKQWIEFCSAVSTHRNSLNPENSRLCIVHFNEENILRNKAGVVTRLRPMSVPTIYTPHQIERLKDLTTDSVLDVAAKIKESFKRITQRTLITIQSSDKTHETNDSVSNMEVQISEHSTNKSKIMDEFHSLQSTNRTEDKFENCDETSSLSMSKLFHIHRKSTEDIRIYDKEGAEDEIQCDMNSSQEVSTSTPTRPTSVCRTNPTMNTLTRTTSCPLPGKARRHSIRYIQDIRVTDLETPKSRSDCLKVIQYESKVMKKKIHALKKQNTRLKKKVQNLKDALEKFRRKHFLSGERTDE